MTQKTLKAAVLGASGYTGAETVRLLRNHPHVEAVAATGNALAGQKLSSIFPHLGGRGDLDVIKAEDVRWDEIDVAFGCLPHGTSQDLIETLPSNVKIVDLSSDYRFRDPVAYSKAYGREHIAPERTASAIYGLSEHAAESLKGADLVACPGCYPTAILMVLLPLMSPLIIDTDSIIIDAKSGASGAGRGLKEGNLFCEVTEGTHAYGVGTHRHTPEIEQELNLRAGKSDIEVTFTPHLLPMARGEHVTCHLRGDVHDVQAALEAAYANQPFVTVLPLGSPPPDTRHVRGTNDCRIAVYPDRVKGRVIVIGVIDNLVKGSSGQAIQNLNLMMGWDQALGLDVLVPLFP
ncbi:MULTISPECIES: N-acetyl-gamma-glutamyl-phosphate reductase [Henriciella]|jgi:N-acetyl-gamma-glutamyl-phosphate reductase|uniref:N-acetyl-gamma-glutamyl-phosphate reductase n=1 Tax=Henriciella pelagia TaxID=1977912 RepID=A0ABQ1J7Y2_9PROT|nr:N-acetyl-gamma-glutamyl-phosphate reductase [Henriciella pelagia]GGB60097.1 N-acetyl-gamma-glutamyl-phosphate reductase [Henriciella pelagia]